MKKEQHVELVVSHHGLIRLIVSHSLTQQQSSWEELISIIEGILTKPSPKCKHATNTPEHPKKRKKSARLSPKRKHATSTSERPKK